ncbi:E3 ubiquitin-protein ligase [Colletotrichum chlorophyti]|uniref:E3 ubiquitin-protein ligase n=1 Tax=Colletotrichum chlorophyti TaxID=708187 RepID=A0A1Q8S1G0_9PEZI|nr:E3 ubiquitin-protein ligase [Colletotrichum chlorophyti]
MVSSVLLRLACAAAAAAVTAQAVSITPQNEIPSWSEKSAMQMSLSSAAGDVVPLTFIVMPSTESLGLNQSDVARGSIRIEGVMVAAFSTNYNSINQNTQIAYLSCDAPEGGGFISPDMMLTTLMENKPKAIVLYSTVGNWCSLSGSDLPYNSIFTMADAGDASQALHILNGTNEVDVLKVTITGNATGSAEGGNSGSSNNSAVAMSILYSITGLITLLFLVIIATGAIRAHRYPERYGPRSGFNGRPRQSRAKGLARAVLDTLPIVKFGEKQEAKPDPNMELESASNVPTNDRSTESPVGGRLPYAAPVNTKHAEMTTTTPAAAPMAMGAPVAIATGAVDTPTAATGVAAGAGATGTGTATNTAKAANSDRVTEKEDDQNLGCSICTEDFTVGEDVRVLPCNHKFHPNCVDPWLVNVSGTCPLCRLDLNPQGETENSEELPPPLELDGHESDGSSTTQRRRIRLFDLNRLRHASAEERIQILRQYRTQHQGQETLDGLANAEHEDRNDRSRRAKLAIKLRDKFRIRTRPQP